MSPETRIHETIGSYVIERRIGKGGMGAVYLARHRLIGYKAAVKVLLPHLCENREIVQRFFNEARAATTIEHPSIVKILDFGHNDHGGAYIVMELLNGESLVERLRRVGRVSVNDGLRIVRQVASALAAAHSCGVIHRDLKPDNVFLMRDPEIEGGERVKILDFGIAKSSSFERDPTDVKTAPGTILGTPQYMAPEQLRGAADVDHRADIYSLGCVFFHLICGRPPFVGIPLGRLLLAHMQDSPPAPSSLEPAISNDIEALILRCLAKNPDERFQSMADVAEAVESMYRIRVTGRYSPIPLHRVRMQASTASHGVTTTIGGSAAEIESAGVRSGNRGSRLAWVGLAVALVVGITGSASLLFSLGHRVSEHSASAIAQPPVDADPDLVITDPAQSHGQPATETLPSFDQAAIEHESPPLPADVVWELHSTPTGAQVIRENDGVVVGNTPYRFRPEPGIETRRFRLEKSGHKPKRVVVEGERGGRLDVRLAEVMKRTRVKRTRVRRTKSRRTSSRRQDQEAFGYR